ncbi:MAG: N-methyl-L-tryptophan oxidase [Verrucomicrobia bacterium]|nr:N-methyl-L-tryptophan oxidase [Verrucomicrobiota bacterium]
MTASFDVIVVGLGAMGSAAACHLARAGRKVLGLDRFTPPHNFGSSHGQTRIIREAYFEHPLYVPLIQRAYELWSELEASTQRRLFVPTGGLMIGRPESVVVSGARRSAELHHLRHEILHAREVRKRFPALQPEDDMLAVWEPRAGILFPESCVAAHLELARRSGADFRFENALMDWSADQNGVEVRTTRGKFRAEQLVLTAGAWMPSLTPELNLPLKVERQIQFWFTPRQRENLFSPDRCPIHIWECATGERFYGFPELGSGVKVARHHAGEPADPDRLRRDVSQSEIAAMRDLVRRFLPDADGPLHETAVCMYTNMPGEHFLIDWHPAHANVLIASPCSGHGFKFSSVVGEVIRELIVVGKSRFDLSLFHQR